MARGWESKDVEAQVTATQEIKDPYSKREKTPEQKKRERERQVLQLSRKHILHDLESATNPHHRKTLEAALAHLDEKLRNSK